MTEPWPHPGDSRAALVAAVASRAASGRASIVTGPSGSGKTWVLGQVHDELRSRGITCRTILATDSASSVPFGAFLPLLDTEALHRIAAADALGRALELRLAMLELHLDVLLVDEAALLDPGGAALVLELAQGGVAVVLSRTSGSRGPDALRVLEGSASARRFDLLGLDIAGIRALTTQVLDAPLEEHALHELTTVSAGRPGLALALLREAVAAGSVVRTDWVWRLRGVLRSPRVLQEVIGDRLSALSEAEHEWIVAVAVADQIADDLRPALAGAATVDRAARAGWTDWHPRTRSHRIHQRATAAAIDAALGVHSRTAARERLVAAFEGATRPLTDIETTALATWRLDLGLDVEPGTALRLGLLTSLSSPELSDRLLAEAARGGSTEAPLALAEHLRRTGRVAEAEAQLGTAVPMTDADADRLAATLASVTGTVGRHSGRALAVLDAQLDAGLLGPESRAVRMCLLLCERRLPEAAEIAAARPLPRRAEFTSLFIGEHEIQLHADRGEASDALAVVAALRGPALRMLDRRPEGPETLEWLTAWVHGVVRLDLTAADAVAGREYRRTLEEGLHASRTQFAYMLGVTALQRGLPAHAARMLAEADALGGVWHDCWLPNILGSLAIALVHGGRLDDAGRVVERLRGIERCPQHEAALTLADAELRAARGDRGTAAVAVRAAADRARLQGATTEQADCLVAAMRFGDPEAAADLLGMPTPPEGRARELQTEWAAALRDADAAALERAAAGFWALDHRVLAIETAVTAVRLGSASAAIRAARWMLATPDLRLPDADRLPSALSRRETAVVGLAATGRSDRQVAEELGISLRTAQTHLGRAFTKLDVHRRGDLAGLLG